MYRYLVIGLESTGTRLVSRILAVNLNLISNFYDWDGFDEIKNDQVSVTHRSMPHGAQDYRHIPDEKFIKNFDCIIITSRDINSVIESKLRMHDNNLERLLKDNDTSVKILKNVLENDNCHIFSYESAVLFQESYLNKFFNSLGITLTSPTFFENENKKYLAGVTSDS